MTEDGEVYFIKGKSKWKIFSSKCVDSWDFAQIVEGTKASISRYTYVGYLGFRDGSLIKNVADGKMYLVSDNKRRHIKTPGLFETLCFDKDLMIDVSDDEASIQQEGEPIV